jgi:putative toxin-antitoxin system antitoxin component (TIGR02293 family)
MAEATMEALTYEAIKRGVQAGTVRELIGSGRLRRSDVQMVIPRRTFERRLSLNQPLKTDEADSIARLLRVRDHARQAFDDGEVAEEWLSLPNPALGGEVPIQMARTDVGAREVEAVLTRLEHGVHG